MARREGEGVELGQAHEGGEELLAAHGELVKDPNLRRWRGVTVLVLYVVCPM